MKIIRVVIFLLGIGWGPFANGQQPDTLHRSFRRNVIKINPTPAIIFGNWGNVTLVYERLIKPNQSILFQVGYLGLPDLLSDSIGGMKDIKRVSSGGLNFAFDYRFYLLRRNQYPSPDGLYIAPYFSYYGTRFTNEFAYYRSGDTVSYGDFSSTYNMANLGVSIGYQFIFWKRLSVDMLIFGPSLTYFATKRKVSGNMTQEDEEELIQAIKEKFNENFPILAPFVKPSEEAQYLKFTMFFRYSISIGFHF